MRRRDFVGGGAAAVLATALPARGATASSSQPIGSEAGVRILTSRDADLQRLAEVTIRDGLARLERQWPALRRKEAARRLQAALICIDIESREVRALVGGRDYRESQLNRVRASRRQLGSTIKPFVYLAALTPHAGRAPYTAASIVNDAPISVAVGTKTWEPRNYDDRYERAIPLRRALAISSNSVATQIALSVGLGAVTDTLKVFGLGEVRALPSIALGAFEATPLAVAQAYLAIASSGTFGSVTTIRKRIIDGKEERRVKTDSRRIVSPPLSHLMTSLLESVVTLGTASSLKSLGVTVPVAGKTGTTNDGRDAWFVGYTSSLLTLLWVGFDRDDVHKLTGAQAALPLWADFMRRIPVRYHARPFARPTGVSEILIDPRTGGRATAACPRTATEIFVDTTAPPPCPEHSGSVS
jgi:penicillin-binding protein 1B